METAESHVDGIDVNGSVTTSEMATLQLSDASTNTDGILNARSSSARNLETMISESFSQLFGIIAINAGDQTRQNILDTMDFLSRNISSLRDIISSEGNNTALANTGSSYSGPLVIAEVVHNRRHASINTDMTETVNFSSEDNADGCCARVTELIFNTIIPSLRCFVYISVLTQLWLIASSCLQMPFIIAALCYCLAYLVPNDMLRLLTHQILLICSLWMLPSPVREIVTLLCVILWGRGNSLESAVIVLEVAVYFFPMVKQFICQTMFDQQY